MDAHPKPPEHLTQSNEGDGLLSAPRNREQRIFPSLATHTVGGMHVH